MSASYITDSEGNVVYPKTLAKCVNKGGSTLEEYLNDVEDATLIKPTVSGTDMVLTDSSNMNIQELRLLGRTEQKTTNGVQLFNINDRLSENISTFSPIYNISEDGYITANIPLVDTEKYYNFFTKPSSLLKINKEYSAVIEIVDNPLNIRVTAISVQENVTGQFSNNVTSTQVGTNITKVTTIDDFSKAKTMCRGYIYVPANISGTVKFRVSIIEGTSVTANNFKYEPYTGGIASPNPEYPQGMNCVKNPSVIVTGKNLAITQNVRGSNNLVNAKIVRGQKYTLSFECNKRVAININSKRQAGTTLININPLKIGRNSCSFIAIDDGDIFFNCYGSTDDTNGLQINNIQIERGDTSSDYEPYKEIQTATLNYELNGIDDVRDELIVRADGTGQLIQRLLKEELNNNSDLRTWYETTKTYGYQTGESKWLFMANKINVKSNKLKGITKEVGNSGAYNENGIFVNTAGCINFKILKKYLTKYTVDALKTYLRDNPITVVGLLKEPIVNELSAEEVKKILAIHTNKPISTIWNDQNADMQITYVADTKNYIDSKFTELENSVCGGLLITDNLIDNSNMLNNTALTISDKISTSSNSTYKTYLNIPVKAGESYYIGKSHRNSCIIDSIENKKVLQSNMVNQTDSYIFNVNYDGFLCVCFYTTEQNPKIALLTREKTES